MESNKKINKFYQSLPAFIDRYDKQARQMKLDVSDMESYENWKEDTRKKLMDISGISRLIKSDLNPEKLESIKKDGYTRDKYIIQVEKDVWMPFYVLIPDDIKAGEKRAAVIAPHGHGSAGKLAVIGEMSIPVVKDTVEVHNYAYGIDFVREGYITFCPDARGFGERRVPSKESEEDGYFLNGSCAELNHMAMPLGITVTGMWAYDLMRLVDYIETRNDCDADRIACGGLSGGGLQTLWLSALDDRIKCSIVSGYFYGYRDSLLKLYQNCSCNYVPHLWETVDMCDLGALIAPRSLLIETGDIDGLNGHRGVDNVIEQFNITKTAYELFDSESALWHNIFHGPHRWDGAMMPEFLSKYL